MGIAISDLLTGLKCDVQRFSLFFYLRFVNFLRVHLWMEGNLIIHVTLCAPSLSFQIKDVQPSQASDRSVR